MIVLYRPYPHQKAVHDAITKHVDKVKRGTFDFSKVFVVKACRQVGKTYLAANELIRISCKFPNSKSAYVTPAFRLARAMFDTITHALDKCIIESANSSTLQIQLKNGSTISFFSAEQRDRLRGFNVDGILVVDEAAFIADVVYYEYLKPWTNARGAITLLISTPDFEKGFFYDLYTAGITEPNKTLEAFDFNDYDLSVIRPATILDEARQLVPPQTFRSEYLGLFRRAEGSVFGNFQDQIMKHAAAEPTKLFYGIDWGSGSGGDYTVVSAFNQHHELCYLWRDNQKAPMEQVAFIRQLLQVNRDKICRVVAEKNSIGKVYLDALKSGLNIPIEAFDTTAESKRKLIETMQVDIQNGQVWLLDDRALKLEFSSFESKTTAKGSLTYSAPMGAHDDIVMSVLMANRAFHTTTNSPYRLSIL